jgi:hypothetical protein
MGVSLLNLELAEARASRPNRRTIVSLCIFSSRNKKDKIAKENILIKLKPPLVYYFCPQDHLLKYSKRATS